MATEKRTILQFHLILLLLTTPLYCDEAISCSKLTDIEIDGDWFPQSAHSIDWSSIIDGARDQTTNKCIGTKQQKGYYYESRMFCGVPISHESETEPTANVMDVFVATSYQDMVICTAFERVVTDTTSYLDLEFSQNINYNHSLLCNHNADQDADCLVAERQDSDLQISFQLNHDVTKIIITISEWSSLLQKYRTVRTEHMENIQNAQPYTSSDGAFKAALDNERTQYDFFENCIDFKALGYSSLNFSAITLKSSAFAHGPHHYTSGAVWHNMNGTKPYNPICDKKQHKKSRNERKLLWRNWSSSSSSSWDRNRPWDKSSSSSGHWDWHKRHHWYGNSHWYWHSSSHWHSDSVETTVPTKAPTTTKRPTVHPTLRPTKFPSFYPSQQPSWTPSRAPTKIPTTAPSPQPTPEPTKRPTAQPTPSPSRAPVTPDMTHNPTPDPTREPTADPTVNPSLYPTVLPTNVPTIQPTHEPTRVPTFQPTMSPTMDPTDVPSSTPTIAPTFVPTVNPTSDPSPGPTSQPTPEPTLRPTPLPTVSPSDVPTVAPTTEPTVKPTDEPTKGPSPQPTPEPTKRPTTQPTPSPSRAPITPDKTHKPTPDPTREPTADPTINPTYYPTNFPTSKPTGFPTDFPTWEPTVNPTLSPTSPPLLKGICCNCTVAKNEPGCPSDKICENIICDIDSFCCDDRWDTDCVQGGEGDNAPGALDICINGTSQPSNTPSTSPTPSPTQIAGALEVYIFYNETRDDYWTESSEKQFEYTDLVQKSIWLSYENMTGYSLDYGDLYLNQAWNYGGVIDWVPCFIFDNKLPNVSGNCPFYSDMSLFSKDTQFVSVNEFRVVSDQNVMQFKRYIMKQFESNIFRDYVSDLLDTLIDLATPDAANGRRLLQEDEDETKVISIHVVDKSNLTDTTTQPPSSSTTVDKSSAPSSSPSAAATTSAIINTTAARLVIPRPIGNELSLAAVIGIIVGIVCFFICLMLAIYYVICYRPKHKQTNGYSAVSREEVGEGTEAVATDEDVAIDSEQERLNGTATQMEEEEEDEAPQQQLTPPYDQRKFLSASQVEEWRRTRGTTISSQKSTASEKDDVAKPESMEVEQRNISNSVASTIGGEEAEEEMQSVHDEEDNVDVTIVYDGDKANDEADDREDHKEEAKMTKEDTDHESDDAIVSIDVAKRVKALDQTNVPLNIVHDEKEEEAADDNVEEEKLETVNEQTEVEDEEWRKKVNVKQKRRELKQGGTQQRGRGIQKRKSVETLKQSKVVSSAIGKFEQIIFKEQESNKPKKKKDEEP